MLFILCDKTADVTSDLLQRKVLANSSIRVASRLVWLRQEAINTVVSNSLSGPQYTHIAVLVSHPLYLLYVLSETETAYPHTD